MLASTESLIAEPNALHEHVRRVLARGENAGDDRLVLRGVHEGRQNVESLLRVSSLGDLEKRVAALEVGEMDTGDQHVGDNGDDEDADAGGSGDA